MLDNVKPETTLFNYMGMRLEHSSPQNVPNDSHSSTQSTSMVYAAIGSERGWTDKERSLFTDYGFASCSMGVRVLRTETATTVALSLILQSMGLL